MKSPQSLILPVWALRDPRIKPGAMREVFMGLLWHQGPLVTASPAIATLAAELGYSERAVRGALRELESAGVIEVERRQAQGLPSVYRVCELRIERASAGRGCRNVVTWSPERPSEGLPRSASPAAETTAAREPSGFSVLVRIVREVRS